MEEYEIHSTAKGKEEEWAERSQADLDIGSTNVVLSTAGSAPGGLTSSLTGPESDFHYYSGNLE